MLDGESYLGRVMIRRLSEAGDVTLYVWPLRCLKGKFGGPTFGVDVKGEEIIRFDPHGQRGHWHKGGYDKLGAGGSHVDYPEGVTDSEAQVAWSLEQLREHTADLLSESGHPEAAASIDAEMLKSATDEIMAHLESEGDQRPRAIELGLINA